MRPSKIASLTFLGACVHSEVSMAKRCSESQADIDKWTAQNFRFYTLTRESGFRRGKCCASTDDMNATNFPFNCTDIKKAKHPSILGRNKYCCWKNINRFWEESELF